MHLFEDIGCWVEVVRIKEPDEHPCGRIDAFIAGGASTMMVATDQAHAV